MSLKSYLFIRGCTKSDRKRDEGLEIPSTVEYIRNLRYGDNEKYHILDVCWPKNMDSRPVDVNKDKLPVIVNVHGGGFVYGSLGMSHHATEDIAMMRALPDVTVVAPGDLVEAACATKAIYETPGTCYL